MGDWVDDDVYPLKGLQNSCKMYKKEDILAARKAFYALCTHIDHQLRILIGTLREENLLNNTIILFTSDHGDMLGNHNMVAKRVMYEYSANIPLIISGKPLKSMRGTVDDRLVCLADIMPTLLDLCGLEIPSHVEGISAVSTRKRDMLYGEISENALATRMVHDGRFKLIYYPVGNYIQLFDLENDPNELKNLAHKKEYSDIQNKLVDFLIKNLYKGDENWVKYGKLVGLPNQEFIPKPDYGLSGQRGLHWPPPIRKT